MTTRQSARTAERSLWTFLLGTWTGRAIVAVALIGLAGAGLAWVNAERVTSIRSQAYIDCINAAIESDRKLTETDLAIIRAGRTPAPRRTSSERWEKP
jgi:hypothetical protein